MSFTMCLNKEELLVLSGFGLLFQGLGLKTEGKLIQDNQRYIQSTIELLSQTARSSLNAFENLAFSLIPQDAARSSHVQQPCSERSVPDPSEQSLDVKGRLQALASRFSFSATRGMKQEHTDPRRTTVPNAVLNGNLALYSRARGSQVNLGPTVTEPTLSARRSLPTMSSNPPQYSGVTNLDYFSLDFQLSTSDNMAQRSSTVQTSTELENLMGFAKTYDTSSPPSNNGAPCYISPEALTYPTPTLSSDWNPDTWSSLDMQQSQFPPNSARSVLSFSDESLTSGEDLSSCDFGSEHRGFAMPAGDYKQEDWDLSGFGL